MKTETYRDEAGEWRWRRRAANGEIIATSGEGFKGKQHAEESAASSFPDDEHVVILDVPSDD